MQSKALAARVNGNDPALAVGLIVPEPSLQRRVVRALADADLGCSACASTAHELEAIAPEVEVTILYARPIEDDGPTLPEIVRTTREALPTTTALVVIWPHCDPSDSRRALRAGADALVSEDDFDRTLGPTIRAVRAGLTCVPQPLRAHLESETLSMREKQVLGMLVMGATNAEIAAQLFVAKTRAKRNLPPAQRSLGVRCRKKPGTPT